MTAIAEASWAALGTTAILQVAGGHGLETAAAAVRRELAAIDHAASRFRADSELSALNRAAGRRITVSPLMREALELALDAAEVSDGAVDPTLGGRLLALGYDRDLAELEPAPAGAGPQPVRAGGPSPDRRPARSSRLRARRAPAWRGVELWSDPPAARLPRGTALDLGATAKALAADRAARAAHEASRAGVLVSLGGDLATCGPPPPAGWAVRIADDHRDPAPDGPRVRIGEGGLATSSLTTRRWMHAGRACHHILDPATGEPADGPWRTVSVMASTCAGANIASTAAIVLGERAAGWLDGQGVPARLIARDGEVLTLGGWPA